MSAAPEREQARVSIVIVTHDSREAVGRTLLALHEELREGDELILVDNASSDGTAEAMRELVPSAQVIETGANLGYGAGSNRGASAASNELLVFLNPDAVPQPGFREAIARPLEEGRGWAAWQGLVTSEDGELVNTRGGVVHFTGVAWAGGAGEPLEPVAVATGDGSEPPAPAEPGFVSGACLAIPRERFIERGGFPEDFFLYHEDVDLSLRLRLSGGRLGVEPAARVDHAYEFEKGAAKWRYLERNRWATLIRCYPAALLVLLAPALIATELALVGISLGGGWLSQKLAAWRDTLGCLPRLLRERRRIQAERVQPTKDFVRALVPELDSPYLGAPGRSGALGAALRAYWSLTLWALGVRR